MQEVVFKKPCLKCLCNFFPSINITSKPPSHHFCPQCSDEMRKKAKSELCNKSNNDEVTKKYEENLRAWGAYQAGTWDTDQIEERHNRIMKEPAEAINHPPHYLYGGLEVIDILEKKLTPDQFYGYLIGSAQAYIFRAEHKGNKAEDIAKAEWYLKRAKNFLNSELSFYPTKQNTDKNCP